MRARALAAPVVCALTIVAAGCGGSTEPPFRIGILSDCYGIFSGSHAMNVASAELPLIRRGAKLLGLEPLDLVGPVVVAGRRVDLLVGCVAGTDEVIPEARRLVEEEGAGALVGPLDPSEGMALREYARRRPETAFLIEPSAAPELTLLHPASNVFRFTPDAAQSTAGLGTYAYRRLGWRRAAVVADDVPYAWAQAAGFVAEFCALGGRVVDRVWIPLGTDPAAAAATVPGEIDGVFLGRAVSPMSRLLRRFAALGYDLPSRLVASAELVTDPGVSPLAAGVVVGGSPPIERTQAERRYIDAFGKAFPRLSAAGALTGTSLAYAQGVEAALEALARTHGSTGEPFLKALEALSLDSPFGRIRLDRNRQAVGPSYLSRVAARGATTLKVVPSVEQTFGGYFTPSGPPPSETSPRCVRRAPPPWAR